MTSTRHHHREGVLRPGDRSSTDAAAPGQEGGREVALDTGFRRAVEAEREGQRVQDAGVNHLVPYSMDSEQATIPPLNDILRQLERLAGDLSPGLS